MIDIRKLKLNGKFNYQNGLSFYYKDHGRFISFYIDDIPVRRRKIKVTMQPDSNHVLPGDGYVASKGKRPGGEWFFSEAFVVFRRISAIFRAFCLVVFGNFVYLHTVKGVATISSP